MPRPKIAVIGFHHDWVGADRGHRKRHDAVAAAVTARMASFARLRKWLSRSTGEGPSNGLERDAIYAHMSGGRSVELARIIDVATDEFGIRHVRFHLAFRYQHKIMEAGERTLAMPNFAARFTERLDSIPD